TAGGTEPDTVVTRAEGVVRPLLPRRAPPPGGAGCQRGFGSTAPTNSCPACRDDRHDGNRPRREGSYRESGASQACPVLVRARFPLRTDARNVRPSAHQGVPMSLQYRSIMAAAPAPTAALAGSAVAASSDHA